MTIEGNDPHRHCNDFLISTRKRGGLPFKAVAPHFIRRGQRDLFAPDGGHLAGGFAPISPGKEVVPARAGSKPGGFPAQKEKREQKKPQPYQILRRLAGAEPATQEE